MGKYRPDLRNKQRAIVLRQAKLKSVLKNAIKQVNQKFGTKPQVVIRVEGWDIPIIGQGLAKHFQCQVTQLDKLLRHSNDFSCDKYPYLELDFSRPQSFSFGTGTLIETWTAKQLAKLAYQINCLWPLKENTIIPIDVCKITDIDNGRGWTTIVKHFCEKVQCWGFNAIPSGLGKVKITKVRSAVRPTLPIKLETHLNERWTLLKQKQLRRLSTEIFSQAKKKIKKHCKTLTQPNLLIELYWKPTYDGKLCREVGKRLAKHYDCRVKRIHHLTFLLYFDQPQGYDRGFDFGLQAEIDDWINAEIQAITKAMECSQPLCFEFRPFAVSEIKSINKRFKHKLEKQTGWLVSMKGNTITVLGY